MRVANQRPAIPVAGKSEIRRIGEVKRRHHGVRCVVGEGQHPVCERAGRIADPRQIDRVALDKAADVRAE